MGETLKVLAGGTGKPGLHWAISMLALSVGLAVAPAASAQEARVVTFDIAPQPLGAALAAFTQKTGITLAYGGTVPVTTSRGAQGAMAPADALSRILAGTGLTYRYTDGATITLEPAPQAEAGTVQIGPLRVEGGDAQGSPSARRESGDRTDAANAPYRTAGSVAHVSREQIDRIPPSSTGDIFLSTPGVFSAGNRNGQSLDLNIRGLQGMNRVATLIDGASQQTSMYRGYGGTSSRTFIDPDLIGGIDISKGPSDSAYGGGAMGGVVNMRTLTAPDLVGEDNGFGIRLKAGIADNSIEPPAKGVRTQRFGGAGLTTDARNLSIAAGYRSEAFELVGAFVQRRNGNYFSGTTGNDRTELISYPAGRVTTHPISKYAKGGEIFNTSRDTQAALAKATARFGDGHAIELGYVRYDSVHGEEYPDGNNPFSAYSWIEQAALSNVLSNIYTGKYRWKPSGNPLIDLHAEVWLSDIDDYWGAYDLRSTSVTKGVDLWNTSLVGTSLGELSLKYGGQYSVEDASARRDPKPSYDDNMAFDGVRKLGRVYVNADLDLTDWTRLSGGLSYEFFRTSGTNWRKKAGLGLEGESVNPRAGILLSPSDGVQIFANYAQGWRPATLRETLLDMDSLIQPNPLLRPEKSRNIEYGINILRDGVIGDDRLKVKLAYFDNSYTDFIMREYGTLFGLPTAYRTYTNIPQVKFRGVELSVDYSWRGLFLEGQFNHYTDIQFCAPTGDNSYLPCAHFTSNADYNSEAVPPSYSGAVTLGGRFLSDRLTLGARTLFAGARAVGRRTIFSGSAYNSEWAPYAVLDLFGSVDLGKHLTVSASVENLTDRFYLDALSRARSPSPGRTVRLSVTGRFGGPTRSRALDALPHQSQLGLFDGDWSGGYAGLVSGYADVESRSTVTRGNGTASNESGDSQDGGLAFSLVAGHNWQLPSRLVLGVEADFGKTTTKGSYNYVGRETTILANYANVESVYRTSNDWQGSLRGRVGFALGRTLLYGTGGLAVRQDHLSREQFVGATVVANPSSTKSSFTETDRKTHLGWIAGLGGAFAVSERWSIRAEYLRSDFGAKDYLFDQARQGVLPTYVQQKVLTNPVTGAILTDPVTGEWLIERTTITRSASVVEGRRAARDAVSQSIRIGVTYRF